MKPRGKDAKPNEIFDLQDFITVKGLKAIGNKLSYDKVKGIERLEEEAAAEVLGISVEEYRKDPFAEVVEEKKEEQKEEESEEEREDASKEEENKPKSSSGDAPQMDLFS